MDSLTRRGFLQSTAMAIGASALAGKAIGADKTTDTTKPAAAKSSAAKGKSPWKKAIKTSILRNVSHDASWEKKLQLAKDTGFEGIEWDDITTPDEAVKIQKMARDMGVPCHGLVFGGWKTPLSDPDPAVVKAGLEGMRNAITCTHAMEVETCLLVPAVVTPDMPYDEAYKRSQDNVRKLIEHAEKNKVIICLENVWNKFLLSPMEFARYIDEIDSPHVRMYFDCSNSLVQGYSEQWMKIMGKRIRKVDCKDYSRKKHKFVPLGEGDADYKAITKILHEWNYDDYVTSESSVHTKEELADSCDRLDKVFSGNS